MAVGKDVNGIDVFGAVGGEKCAAVKGQGRRVSRRNILGQIVISERQAAERGPPFID